MDSLANLPFTKPMSQQATNELTKEASSNSSTSRGSSSSSNSIPDPTGVECPQLPPRFRVTEKGLLDLHNEYVTPSFYHQSLLLLYELDPPHSIHPRAVPRLLHLLRVRIIELASPQSTTLTSKALHGDDGPGAMTLSNLKSCRCDALEIYIRAYRLVNRTPPDLTTTLTNQLVELHIPGNHISEEVMKESLDATQVEERNAPLVKVIDPQYAPLFELE